jgi:hypothetical protein
MKEKAVMKEESKAPIPTAHCRQAAQAQAEKDEKEDPLYWIQLIGHSFHYIHLLGLTWKQVEALIAGEEKRNVDGKFGFASIVIEGKTFVFIPGIAMASDYGVHCEDGQKFYHCDNLIMAYCVDDDKLNTEKEIRPWSGAGQDLINAQQKIDIEIATKGYSDYDYEEFKPWTNVIPDEWHEKIIHRLEKEIADEKQTLENITKGESVAKTLKEATEAGKI